MYDQRRGDTHARRDSSETRAVDPALQLKQQLQHETAGLPVKEQLASLAPARPMAAPSAAVGGSTGSEGKAVQRSPDEGAAGGDGETDPMAGLPQTKEEIADSIRSVSLAATLAEGRTLAKEGPVTLKMQDSTRLSVRVDGGGLFIGASPGFAAEVDWLPDAEIHSLRYDFRQGAFTAEAEGVGPDFIYGWAVAAAANKYFKPRLPGKMQAAGYSPHRDDDAAQTYEALGGIFQLEGDTEFPSADVADVSASVGFTLKDGIVYPVAGGDAEFRIEPGAYLSLSGELSGATTDPTVERITIGASSGDVKIAKVGEGFAASLQAIVLRSVTIRKGGAVSFDYDLEVEGMLEGLIGLAKLLALMAGEPRLAGGNVPDVKLKAIREQVDAKLSEEVGPQLKALIQQYDSVVPGMSLVKAFGI